MERGRQMRVGWSKMAIFAFFARYIFRTFTSKATFFWPPGTTVPDGLIFCPICFLGSHISEVPRPIATKLCHMIGIWLESPAKVQKLGGPPLKNMGPKHA